MEQLQPSTRIVAIPDQVSCDLAGEAAILNLRDGVYYSLNPIGAEVWNMLQQPKAVSEVLETLLREYDVERERCEADLLKLLSDLGSHGLVQVCAP